MEVYIVRHGQTVWNAKGWLQGRRDIDLNENGIELARAYGRKIAQIPFDRIYSSPLKRAYDTACLIRGDRDIPIIKDDRLRELSFGIYEGRSFEDNTFFDNPGSYRAPEQGESLEDLCMRAKDFLTEVIEPQKDSCQRIMIVAHGALNKGLMCHIEGNDIPHFWGQGLQKNCEADVFTFDGKWQHK